MGHVWPYGSNDTLVISPIPPYARSETNNNSTLQPAFAKDASRSSIGVPLDTVSAFVLEYSAESDVPTDFKVVPLGQVGELAVGGFQLARGYINRPEQTSATFIDSPWGRLYRTGDKARMQPDGTIECLGRINDAQVKLNGQRIELGEIEQAILRADGCHAAVATVISNTLVAFAAAENAEGIHERISASCKSWLPAFMIPAETRVMPSFPQLPSGKIDRKRLVGEYEASISNSSEPETKFESELERRLCEIGRSLFGPRLSPRTQLSVVGLDSLVAIQYASLLRDAGILVDIVDILEASTIHGLTRIIESGGYTQARRMSTDDSSDNRLDLSEKHAAELHAVFGPQVDEIDYISSCTPLQTAMLVETLKDSRLYVNQLELIFPPGVSASTAKSWILDIAQRNETLRTGFIQLEHALRPVVWKQLMDQVQIVDHFSEVSIPDAEQFLQHPLQIELMEPEDAEGCCKTRLTIHHSIYDGWTIDLLIEDLSAVSSGETPRRRPQFGSASRELTSIPESRLMSAKEYWAENLRGCASSSAPNFRTVAVQNPEIMTDVSEIHLCPEDVTQKMRSSDFSPQVLFQACLSWLWAAMTGSDEVILGSVSSGRTTPIPGIEDTMGPFIATLPLRVFLQRCRTINELLQNIHTANRERLRHEVLSLSEVKRAAGLQPSTRLFDVIFVYQESLASRRHRPSGVREVWHKDAVESSLLVEILPLGDHYTCQVTWHSDVYSHQQVRAFAQHLDILAKAFIDHFDDPLDRVPRYFPRENLSTYNVKPACLDTYESMSELVENTALLYPNHQALNFAKSIRATSTEIATLTYQELNSSANQIARHIRQSGASSSDIIAIIMEKSSLLYRNILGVLKAGCAYLPILPTTPINRIKLILEQASPSLCLVDHGSYRLISGQVTSTVLNVEDVPLSNYDTSNLSMDGDPSRLAYIIYTSGTTGTPKGVSVTNRNMLSNIEALSRIYPYSPQARMLQVCSQAFDVSVFEIFFAWATGMCVCAGTNDTLFEDLERAVRMLKVTHLSMTVTVASLINPRNVPDVEFLVTSGEPMTDEVLEKWADSLYQGKLQFLPFFTDRAANLIQGTAPRKRRTYVLCERWHAVTHPSSLAGHLITPPPSSVTPGPGISSPLAA